MFINIKALVLPCLLLCLMGCQEDLFPSNDTKTSNQPTREGETIDDIAFTFSNGTRTNISSSLSQYDAVVLYFTMWCPVCDSHMSYIRSQIKPRYDNVKFIFVDYVSGSVINTANTQRSKGYSDFDVIADNDNALENYFNGTMASTIIIDKNFIVRLNGLFKTGNDISDTLDQL